MNQNAFNQPIHDAIRRRQALAALAARHRAEQESKPEFILPEKLPAADSTATRLKSLWTKWSKRQRRIATAAAVAILVVSMFTTLFATNVAYSREVLKPLPAANTTQVIGYLQAVKINISQVQSFAVPNINWNAAEEVQFEARQGASTGEFVLLAYPSANHAGADAFRATFNPLYHAWKMIQLSNCILLVAPDTPDNLRSLVVDQVAHFLVGQYRPFLPQPAQAPQ